MTTVTARLDHAPVLSSWQASHRADLSAHLAHHGPPPLPTRGDRAWPDRFASDLEASGLTGRGGAAFSCGAKVRHLRAAGGAATLVVNAMEGEPASLKDRVLLTCLPHLVLDGAELMAVALGARRVAVGIAADDRDVAHVLTRAIAERAGGQLAPVPVDVVAVPGGYVTGEESALAAAVDGRPGLPSFRPDKSVPVVVGRRRALVHNAETLAHVALIARHGPEWFRSGGCPDAPGTALVTVSGAVECAGVVEVAMGTSLREIVSRCRPRGAVTAALVGGFGGGWVRSDALDTPYTPGALAARGTVVGPGVVVVLDDTACGLAETARIASYLAGESAGQCGPCVFGLPAIASDLHRLARGAAGADPRPALERRFELVSGRGACRHPDGAVRMARSALSVFGADAAEHAAGRPCPRSHRPSVLGEVIGRWTARSA